jgi:triacylglycerol lipase
MSDFALLLLVAALAFASVAWGTFWVQRRRALARGASHAPPALGPAPRGTTPGALPGNDRRDATAGAPLGDAPSDVTRAGAPGRALLPARPLPAPGRHGPPVPAADRATVDGAVAGAVPSAAADLALDETEAAARARASSSADAAAAGAAARAEAEAAVEAASAAASAAGAAPGEGVVTIEAGSRGETAVTAAKPAEDADRAPVVVLVHGILGFDQMQVLGWRVHYFRGVADHLRRAGVNAYVVRLPPLDSIQARALALAEFVKALPHRRVTIVAHSMGGLDARYAITRLGLAERVPVLVTVATPHRGTPLADVLVRRPARLARKLAARLGVRSEAIECLTLERMAQFNDEVPDAPGVTYACVPCGRRARPAAIHPLLRPTHAYLRRVAGPNDGLVPVSSQLWGAVVEEIEADHWAQTGWSRRFDAPLFYADVVVHLAQLGLLPPPSFAELAPAALPPRAPHRLGPASSAPPPLGLVDET